MATPNMSLTLPGVGTTQGPDYATEINADLTLVDQHDHSSGKGVQITPAGMNINSALTFANNFATNVAGVSLYLQTANPSTNGTVYYKGVDLYFKDGNGNPIQITASGGVNGTPGSITGLVSPASATFVSASSTFVWQSNTNIAANLDCGSVKMRNLSPNSTFALTLAPPSGLAANYTLTLPSLPAAQQFMTIDNLGNIIGYANVTNGITRDNLVAVGQQSATFTSGNISMNVPSPTSNLLASVSITTTGRPVIIIFQGTDPVNSENDQFSLACSGISGSAPQHAGGSWQIVRDTSTLVGSLRCTFGNTSGLFYFPSSAIFIDAPSAGSHTYDFEVVVAYDSGDSGAITAVWPSGVLTVYEL